MIVNQWGSHLHFDTILFIYWLLVSSICYLHHVVHRFRSLHHILIGIFFHYVKWNTHMYKYEKNVVICKGFFGAASSTCCVLLKFFLPWWFFYAAHSGPRPYLQWKKWDRKQVQWYSWDESICISICICALHLATEILVSVLIKK